MSSMLTWEYLDLGLGSAECRSDMLLRIVVVAHLAAMLVVTEDQLNEDHGRSMWIRF